MTRKECCKKLERELKRRGWIDVRLYPAPLINGGQGNKEEDYEELYDDLRNIKIIISYDHRFSSDDDDYYQDLLDTINNAIKQVKSILLAYHYDL